MKRRPASICSQLGFTLLEVVLALAIFALIGAILYGSFSLSQNAVAKGQASFEKTQKLRSFLDLVGAYVRSSYPYRVSPQDQTVFYQGESDSLTFISSYSLAMGGRGLAKIRIYREGDSAKSGALRLEEESPVRIDEEDDDGGERNSITLEEGVGALTLAYLDPQSEDEKWDESWDGQERRVLPRAVRLSYITRNGKETSWIFPVMMNVLAR